MLSVNVTKNFVGGFRIEASFDAPPGVTILFGASGSGKTTTLRMIAGLTRPDAGRISIDGRALFDSDGRIDVPIRERRAGYVFQNAALLPHLTARANVEFALRRASRATKRERALALLEKFGVAHAAERRPRAISGGEAQRVALARALASGPQLLLLDEPLSALDEATKLGIIEDLRRANRELQLPVLYVTHSQEEAYALGERAVVYERGRVVATGTPEEVFRSPVRAGVARLAGVENIFDATVEERRAETGTSVVVMKDALTGATCRVEVPLSRHGAGASVRVAVRSGDILLATERPRGISARNVLEAKIVSVEDRGGRVLVRARGGVEWVASLTRQSVAELGLESGRAVWLAFKTHSCSVLED
ncbi:MAG TPA: molybdenum ABC transporter ATP-binding protein [Pyrinomonadaceae bacterium]|nr:molybdenum ABC transporter ATP-binding protein [Pyrinomonadaceae bacterium]